MRKISKKKEKCIEQLTEWLAIKEYQKRRCYTCNKIYKLDNRKYTD